MLCGVVPITSDKAIAKLDVLGGSLHVLLSISFSMLPQTRDGMTQQQLQATVTVRLHATVTARQPSGVSTTCAA